MKTKLRYEDETLRYENNIENNIENNESENIIGQEEPAEGTENS